MKKYNDAVIRWQNMHLTLCENLSNIKLISHISEQEAKLSPSVYDITFYVLLNNFACYSSCIIDRHLISVSL